MTTRDFELIAEVLSEVQAYTNVDRGTIELTSKRMADSPYGTNPRFDRERFLRACGF